MTERSTPFPYGADSQEEADAIARLGLTPTPVTTSAAGQTVLLSTAREMRDTALIVGWVIGFAVGVIAVSLAWWIHG